MPRSKQPMRPVQIDLRPEEYDELKATAKERGETLSGFVRRKLGIKRRTTQGQRNDLREAK